MSARPPRPAAEAGTAGGKEAAESRSRIISWRRLLVSLAGGGVAAVVVAAFGAPELSVLLGWAVAAAGVLVWVWRTIWPQDHRGTKRVAEEEGRTYVTDTVVLVAAVGGLVAVVTALAESGSKDPVALASVVLGVVVVILSWALVNTVFALKYARLYYADTDGGIDFKQVAPPAYSDFAYMAFTVGMSFAVSETEPESTEIRKTALGHALLSYLFGTVVIAVSINLVTNLGQ